MLGARLVEVRPTGSSDWSAAICAATLIRTGSGIGRWIYGAGMGGGARWNSKKAAIWALLASVGS